MKGFPTAKDLTAIVLVITMFQGVALHATDRRNAENGTFMIVERKEEEKEEAWLF